MRTWLRRLWKSSRTRQSLRAHACRCGNQPRLRKHRPQQNDVVEQTEGLRYVRPTAVVWLLLPFKPSGSTATWGLSSIGVRASVVELRDPLRAPIQAIWRPHRLRPAQRVSQRISPDINSMSGDASCRSIRESVRPRTRISSETQGPIHPRPYVPKTQFVVCHGRIFTLVVGQKNWRMRNGAQRPLHRRFPWPRPVRSTERPRLPIGRADH